MCLLQFVEMRFSSFFIIFLFYIKGMKAGGDVMRKKKLISYISEAVTIVLLLILGIVALIDGELFASSLSIIAGVTLLLIGLLTVIGAFISSAFVLGSGFKIITGIISSILGIYFLINPKLSLIIITLSLGFILLMNGVLKFVRSFDLRGLKVKTWFVDTILGVVYIVIGVVLLFFSDGAIDLIRILIGIFLIIASILNLCEFISSIIRTSRDEKVINIIKKHVDDADHIDIDFTK